MRLNNKTMSGFDNIPYIVLKVKQDVKLIIHKPFTSSLYIWSSPYNLAKNCYNFNTKKCHNKTSDFNNIASLKKM